MDKKEVGRKVRVLREGKGLTKNALATLAGVSPNYIADIEHGEKCPTVETLDYICFALGVTLRDFFADEQAEYKDRLSELSPRQKELLNDFLSSIV